MDAIALVVGGLALLGVIYAILRINRVAQDQDRDIKALRSKVSAIEQELRKSKTPSGQGNRNNPNPAQQQNRSRNEPMQPSEPRQSDRSSQQNQPKKRNEFKQNEPRQNERPPQQNERQKQQREQQPEKQPQQQRERAQQPPREKPKQANTPKPRPLPMPEIDLDQITGQEATVQQSVQEQPAPEAFAARKYAIIPEDGMIRQHQLQVQPDSDSYIEVDMPQSGQSNFTKYRFNLSGNQAFVISQGIDRLENAFAFEKPSNRMVSRILQQGDGVLAKTESGWRIQEKAKIDFR
ncbi:hypothetical protein [Pontibacter arcticus]|uniref:Uncharacterized protein n=1 Tax=Pontibacter arcticus TaxID=2080288 RepID=A0A364REP7_9BACT|nr:hypothetical protein [Pontibacter arcticus]RAU82737.1 hypothetical protein DP923_05635 [Pontibacter arcticus]